MEAGSRETLSRSLGSLSRRLVPPFVVAVFFVFVLWALMRFGVLTENLFTIFSTASFLLTFVAALRITQLELPGFKVAMERMERVTESADRLMDALVDSAVFQAHHDSMLASAGGGHLELRDKLADALRRAGRAEEDIARRVVWPLTWQVLSEQAASVSYSITSHEPVHTEPGEAPPTPDLLERRLETGPNHSAERLASIEAELRAYRGLYDRERDNLDPMLRARTDTGNLRGEE